MKKRGDDFAFYGVTTKDVLLVLAGPICSSPPISTYLLYPVPVHCTIPAAIIFVPALIVMHYYYRKIKNS